jgi:hypothetical protein
MLRSPFVAACAAVAVYGLAIGFALNVDARWELLGGEVHEWLTAVGTVLAAFAAVVLGVRAVGRESRDDRGKARLTAYMLVRDLHNGREGLAKFASRSFEEDLAFVLAMQTTGGQNQFVGYAAGFNVNRIKQYLEDLRRFPGDLGYRVASLVPFTEKLKIRRDEALQLHSGRTVRIEALRDEIRAELLEIELIVEAVACMADGDDAALQPMLDKLAQLP